MSTVPSVWESRGEVLLKMDMCLCSGKTVRSGEGRDGCLSEQHGPSAGSGGGCGVSRSSEMSLWCDDSPSL